jgi:CMP-N-acetylneuraminic acid synthetase
MILAIIPARLNSKRIPYKNIKSFYGKNVYRSSMAICCTVSNNDIVFYVVMVS